MATLRAPRAILRPTIVGAALLSVASCGGGAEAAVSRETFVEAYVDLRRAALRSPGVVISPAARDSVLALHEVTEEELLRFAEVHGTDVEYMAGVWADVEARLEPDTLGAPPPGAP